MTYQEINTLISNLAESLNVEYAYSAFQDGVERDEFLVFLYPDHDDLYADNQSYQEIVQLDLEWYSSEKNTTKEKIIRDFLNAHDMAFDQSSSYIDSEKMYMTTFTTEVLINE